MLTLLEAFATLLLLRFFFRLARWLFGLQSPSEHPVERAARLVGFEVREGFNARPQWWQRARHPYTPKLRGGKSNPYAPRPTPQTQGAD